MTDTATIAETLRGLLEKVAPEPRSLGTVALGTNKADASFFAACSPDNIRALLDERDALAVDLAVAEAEIARLKQAVAEERAAEREACAKVAATHFDLRHNAQARANGLNIAAAIRARSEEATDAR